MILEAFIFLLVVLLVLRPLAQRQRERAVAEKLKKTRDPMEAMIIVDNAMQAGKSERNLFEKLLYSYRFWLR